MSKYINDPREMAIQPEIGVTYEEDNRKEHMYHRGSKVLDLCGLPWSGYMKPMAVITKGGGGDGATGPQGPQGPTGPQGSTGPQGATGASSMSAQNYTEATQLATSGNVGQVVNVLNEEIISGETYTSGLYIITGQGTVSKLGLSSATGQVLAVNDLLTQLPSSANPYDRFLVGNDVEGYKIYEYTPMSETGELSVSEMDFDWKYGVRILSKGLKNYVYYNGHLKTYDDIDCGEF